MPDETPDDKAVFSAEHNFRAQVFHVIIVQINQSMATRLSDKKKNYVRPLVLWSQRFPELKNGVPEKLWKSSNSNYLQREAKWEIRVICRSMAKYFFNVKGRKVTRCKRKKDSQSGVEEKVHKHLSVM